MRQFSVIGLVICALMACEVKDDRTSETKVDESAALPFEVRRTIEHDPRAYTQGLVYEDGKLFESTGGDSSWIAEYDINTSRYEKKTVLDKTYFGEGITVLNNKVYQLTWRSKIGFIYDLDTFERIGTFSYDFEGWGITHDNQHLIISDGTDKLHYFDTLRLTPVFTKSITHNNLKATHLNELEFIDGHVFANKYESNLILKIDTGAAAVVKEYDFSHIAREVKRGNPQVDVLNGIAYNPDNQDVFITGKLWPFMYVVRLR